MVFHGRKVNMFGLPRPEVFALIVNCGLLPLCNICYEIVDKGIICGFVERWYRDTNTFHLPFGEISITLDDVSCLLHLYQTPYLLPLISTKTIHIYNIPFQHLITKKKEKIKKPWTGCHPARFTKVYDICKSDEVHQLFIRFANILFFYESDRLASGL